MWRGGGPVTNRIVSLLLRYVVVNDSEQRARQSIGTAAPPRRPRLARPSSRLRAVAEFAELVGEEQPHVGALGSFLVGHCLVRLFRQTSSISSTLAPHIRPNHPPPRRPSSPPLRSAPHFSPATAFSHTADSRLRASSSLTMFAQVARNTHLLFLSA